MREKKKKEKHEGIYKKKRYSMCRSAGNIITTHSAMQMRPIDSGVTADVNV